MTRPLLQVLNVEQTERVESLSIPIQQISRVLADGKQISEEQRDLIAQVVDPEQAAEAYLPFISDPVKLLIVEAGRDGYLSEHLGEYGRLWLQLGLAYPLEYLKAWADQTKGYWNGGYEYWVWTDIGSVSNVHENQLGITGDHSVGALLPLWERYSQAFTSNSFLNPLVSIGLAVWLYLAVAGYAVARRKRTGLALVPVIAVLATLLIATPVAYEFRYAYAVFATLPVAVVAVVRSPRPTSPRTPVGRASQA